IDLVGETGPVAKVVLLILLIFSLVSWAIILSKWSVLRRARVQSGRFVRAFRKAQRLQDVGAVAEQFRPSPLVGVFEGGFEEYRRQGAVSNGIVRSPLAIQRAMQIANSEELTRFERNLPWLAITGAVTPFIGLFGTVWGIIDAFHGLGTAGAATLRAVAPGISEALITTAAGMAATNPAAVMISASEIPGATARRVAAPAVPRPWKASMMPHTVPNSPTKGVTAPVIASHGRLRSKRVSSSEFAICMARWMASGLLTMPLATAP